MIYLFTYDLKPKRRVDRLIEALKTFPAWCNYLERTWLLATYDEYADQINDRLRQHLGDNDHYLIVRIAQDYQGMLPEEAWEWVEETATTVGF